MSDGFRGLLNTECQEREFDVLFGQYKFQNSGGRSTYDGVARLNYSCYNANGSIIVSQDLC